MSYFLSPFGMGNFDAISGSSPDEHRVREIISEVLEEEKEVGSFDDTKVYSTYKEMITKEPEGREDVLYILTVAESPDDVDDEGNVINRGTRYIWDSSKSKYEPIQDSITRDELLDIFNE